MQENQENPNEEEVVIENQAVETPPAEPKVEEPKLDYNLEHRQFIEENEIELKKVPLPIRKKMGIMNMLVSKYKKNPTAGNKNVLIKTDITICDMLQNWKERDYPDNFIEPKEGSTPNPVETPAVETPVVETPVVETPVEVDESEMEKLVNYNLFNGNRIKIATLQSIIKKTPDYPQQIVGNLRLRKVFLADCYEIVQ